MDKTLEERRIVRRDEVAKLTGLARATIYKKVGDGSFPQPIRLSNYLKMARRHCRRNHRSAHAS